MTAPTKDQIRRGWLNVRQLVLEGEALLEHSTPDRVVSEMLMAAASIAHDHGMAVDDLIHEFGEVLCTATRRDLSILVEFHDDDDGEDGE